MIISGTAPTNRGSYQSLQFVANKLISCSSPLSTDLGLDEEEDEAVPLPNVNAAILKKVIQWCTYHKDDPPPPEDDENKEKRTDDISSWDSEFLKVDQGTLFELILVSFVQGFYAFLFFWGGGIRNTPCPQMFLIHIHYMV